MSGRAFVVLLGLVASIFWFGYTGQHPEWLGMPAAGPGLQLVARLVGLCLVPLSVMITFQALDLAEAVAARLRS